MELKNKKILVTYGQGFLGSYVVSELKAEIRERFIEKRLNLILRKQKESRLIQSWKKA